MNKTNDGRLIKGLYEHFVNLFFDPNVDEKEIKEYLSCVTSFVPDELHVLLQPLQVLTHNCIYCGTPLYCLSYKRYSPQWLDHKNYYCPICGHRPLFYANSSDEFCSCSNCNQKKAFIAKLEKLKKSPKTTDNAIKLKEMNTFYKKWLDLLHLERTPVINLHFYLLIGIYALDEYFNIYRNNIVFPLRQSNTQLVPTLKGTRALLNELILQGYVARCEKFKNMINLKSLSSDKAYDSNITSYILELNLNNEVRSEIQEQLNSLFDMYSLSEILETWHWILSEDLAFFIKEECEKHNLETILIPTGYESRLTELFSEYNSIEIKKLVRFSLETLKRASSKEKTIQARFWNIFEDNIKNMKVENNLSIYSNNSESHLFAPYPSAIEMAFENVVFEDKLDERICYWTLPANIDVLQQVVSHMKK